MARAALVDPETIREIAFKYDYEEIEVAESKKDEMVSFRHPSKEGCGGKDSEVFTIIISFCSHRLLPWEALASAIFLVKN